MKLIFSRKGFDSAAGGMPSPILPTGRLCSLPIPDRSEDAGGTRFCDIAVGELSMGDIVRDLSAGRIAADHEVHLDPDLDKGSLQRETDWRPLFGQSGSAQSHLVNQGVGVGDIFVFFGWFRRTEWHGGHLRFSKRAPDVHVLFGWLQVGEVLAASAKSEFPGWARSHPHVRREAHPVGDTVYMSTRQLQIDGRTVGAPGGGTFSHFAPALQLTAPGCSRSTWQLPVWFHPEGRASALSYHENPDRWERVAGGTRLKCVGRGQEFVLDCGDYTEATDWLRQLLDRN